MDIIIKKEIDKQYIEAVKKYEKQILQNNAPIDYYTNLSFIYWSFAFEKYEFCIPNNILRHWSILGGNRYMEILDIGLARFPESVELQFWSKYFPHISFGEEFTKTDCLKLIDKYDNDSLVPYFFLYLFDNEKYKEQRDDLLLECKNLPTAKNRYIISIIK